MSANQKGNVITYVIVAMTMAATLAVGMVYMGSSSTFGLGEITANNFNRAYVLAQAGKDYALLKPVGYTTGRNFTFANGDKFSLVIRDCTTSPTYNIESTGIVSPGTPFEARRKISINTCP
ncbi:MAG: hypothetical protein ABR911_06055 [Syntrophales bacterium]